MSDVEKVEQTALDNANTVDQLVDPDAGLSPEERAKIVCSRKQTFAQPATRPLFPLSNGRAQAIVFIFVRGFTDTKIM